MTETLRGHQEYDPLLDYSTENYPPASEQAEFFKYALLEGAEIEKGPKLIAGPLYGDFTDILKKVDVCLTELNPNYTADYLVPGSYQSPETVQAMRTIPMEDRFALGDISTLRLLALQRVAQGEKGLQMQSQAIPSGKLDVPYYAKQREDWAHANDSIRGCTNACFRMIFGSIAGWVPSQAAVSESLEAQYGTSIVDDAVYSNIYKTEVFGEICDKSIAAVEIIGADFAIIYKLTSRIK